MTDNQLYAGAYLFWVTIRLYSFGRRWKLPAYRGDDWFFNLHVGPGFYHGAGRGILRRHRLWLCVPFAVELAALAAILRFGELRQLIYLMLGMMVLVIGGHAFALRAAQREARPFAIGGESAPAAAVVLSLKPRQLADYTNRRLDIVLGLVTMVCLAWLARRYASAGGELSLGDVFGMPFLLIYLQVGMALIKRALVAWRTPAPREGAEEYLAWRDYVRRFLLTRCDAFRVLWTVCLVGWAVRQSAAEPWEESPTRTILAIALAACLAGFTVWMIQATHTFLAQARRARPVKLAQLESGEGHSGRVVWYRSGNPIMLVRGVRGYALNLASARTQVGAAYLAGLVAIWVLVVVR